MNILMVDDDAHVLESIKKRIDWDEVKIQQIYMASHVQEARQLLLQYPVDILLCDIEMPQETGLDLLAWIRERKLDIQVLLLTSYAEFHYAQRALSLECLEYYLKPVDYERLTSGLKRAVKKVKAERKYEIYKKIQYFDENSPEFAQMYFWYRMATGALLPAREEIQREIRTQNLPYSDVDYFCVCVISLAESEKFKNIEENLSQLLFEAYTKWKVDSDTSIEAVVPMGKQQWTAIFRRREAAERPQTALGENLLKYCRQVYDMEGICGLGDWCRIEDFYDQVKEIQEIAVKSKDKRNQTICQWDYQVKEIPYCIPEIESWEILLSEGRTGYLKDLIRIYLKQQENGPGISRHILKQFRLDMTQMIFTYLRKCGIQAHRVFHNRKNDQLHRDSVYSLENMCLYVNYLLDQSAAYKAISDRPQGAIERVKTYIDHNLGQNLSRDELAAMVYLNPDYLSRRFKEEKGMSISSYLMDKRIEKAKELLCTTSMPINAVAMEVGYDNFAYFAKIFRSKNGLSPNEYRKKTKYEE